MGEAIGQILPAAVGVALSPMPVVAVILMLFSDRAKQNGLSFLVGWVGGLVIVLAVALFLANPEDVSGESNDPSRLSSVIHLLLGLLLLGLAVKDWRGRPRPGQEATLPGWMAKLDSASPPLALGMGAFLSGLNPKNLAFTIAAALAIAQAQLPAGEALLPVVIYVVLASVSVAAPVLWFLVSPAAAGKALEGWRVWLTANNATVMAVLLLVLGVKLFGQGLGGLLG
jgi:hypothetical protein